MKKIVILFSLLFCSSAFAQGIVPNTSSASDFTGTVLATVPTVAFAVTAGNDLMILCRHNSASASCSVTDKAGNKFAASPAKSNAAGIVLQWFTATNVAGNSADVINCGLSPSDSYAACLPIQANNAGGLDTHIENTSPTGAPSAAASSGTFTTTQANELVLMAVSGDSHPLTYTPASGYTIVASDPNKNISIQAVNLTTIGTGVNVPMKISQSVDWVSSLITIKGTKPGSLSLKVSVLFGVSSSSAVTALNLSAPSSTCTAGQTVQVSVADQNSIPVTTGLTWSSSDAANAPVSVNGLVGPCGSPTNAETVTITASLP